MLAKERQKISQLRRKIALSIIIILLLLYWVRLKYYDLDFAQDEIEILQKDVIDLEKQNTKLQTQLDSIKVIKTKRLKKSKPKIIINTKKTEPIKDTITPQILDSSTTNLSDTI